MTMTLNKWLCVGGLLLTIASFTFLLVYGEVQYLVIMLGGTLLMCYAAWDEKEHG